MADASITELLEATRAGNAEAADRLFRQPYPQLHHLAEAKLGWSSRTVTLHPTALVNEAILRILKAEALSKTPNGASFFIGRAGHAVGASGYRKTPDSRQKSACQSSIEKSAR